MTDEVVFIKLPCGCEWSPVAGLAGHPDGADGCDHGEDKHQEFIKAEQAKAAKK